MFFNYSLYTKTTIPGAKGYRFFYLFFFTAKIYAGWKFADVHSLVIPTYSEQAKIIFKIQIFWPVYKFSAIKSPR